MNRHTIPAVYWVSLQKTPSRSSSSDQQAGPPLSKRDLLIVVFGSSILAWGGDLSDDLAALRQATSSAVSAPFNDPGAPVPRSAVTPGYSTPRVVSSASRSTSSAAVVA